MDDAPEDSRVELDRLEELQYFTRMEEAEALELFPDGSVAKLLIIVRTRSDGSVKRRIIIDMRRGGQNARSGSRSARYFRASTTS